MLTDDHVNWKTFTWWTFDICYEIFYKLNYFSWNKSEKGDYRIQRFHFSFILMVLLYYSQIKYMYLLYKTGGF